MDEARAKAGLLRGRLPHSGRGRLLLTSAVVLVLAGTGLGTWAADTWPWPKERYCWGAWEEDSGPGFLGDEAFGEDDEGSRTSEETAPTHERPTGSCEIVIAADYTSGYDGDEVTSDERVTVEYGPLPEAAEPRFEKLRDGFLGGDVVPLPDGLPGTVNAHGGLLVLPESCDTEDGRPTVVTLRTSGVYTSGSSYTTDSPADLGGARQAAVLLVEVANRGMAAAGCAPDEPLEVTSPLLDLPGAEESFIGSEEDVCGVRGLYLGMERLEYRIGAFTRDLQTCSVRSDKDGTPYLDLAAVAQPRLAAVFDGVTGQRPVARGWRGTGSLGKEYAVVRAECAGRTVVLTANGVSTDLRHLAAFADAAAARLGCAPIAPSDASDPEGADR
ncbi:hypothetical protein [Streptomyces sp. NPDC056600]|uniref:hypothetical protein n=1 Tax=Streptomyces sp. NPDC056600 TaxID=3345874 RepID=UPI00367DDC65